MQSVHEKKLNPNSMGRVNLKLPIVVSTQTKNEEWIPNGWQFDQMLFTISEIR
jgi:hypothetical protein